MCAYDREEVVAPGLHTWYPHSHGHDDWIVQVENNTYAKYYEWIHKLI